MNEIETLKKELEIIKKSCEYWHDNVTHLRRVLVQIEKDETTPQKIRELVTEGLRVI